MNRNLKKQHYWQWAALVVPILVIGFYLFQPQAIMVEPLTIAPGPLTVTVEEEGKTRVIDRYDISAPVAGYLKRIEKDVGDSLNRGDVITYLEPLRSDVLDPRRRAEAEARVAAARSSLQAAKQQADAAQAEAEFADNEYQRKQRLKQTNFVSEEELQQASTLQRRAQANLRSANFAVEVSEYELAAAETLLSHSAAKPGQAASERVVIATPINGSILKLYRESEGVVAAGTPLLAVGDPQALEVAVDVLSHDAVKILPGTKVIFERWGGSSELSGVVRRVEPVGFTEISALGVEEQRVMVIADISSPAEQWTKLGDGYRVEARFILWHRDSVLSAPESSLFRHGDGWAVFTINDDEAELTPVEIGQRNGLYAEVTAGLNEGDRIITHPDERLQHGSRVEINLVKP